jgi:hypothetical protein
MAALNFGDCHLRLVVICANGEGITITFPISENGLAIVTFLCLSVRFQLNKKSLHTNEDVLGLNPPQYVE